MADEKAKPKKSAALYDHPSSKKARDKEGASHTEKTKVQTDLKSGEKNAKPQHEPKAADKKPAGDSKPAPTHRTIHERHHIERDGMHRMHEGERRDMHGNHREEQRQMHDRHQKAHKDLSTKHLEELAAQPMPGAGAPVTGAEAVGAAGGAPQGAPAGAPPMAAPAPAVAA